MTEPQAMAFADGMMAPPSRTTELWPGDDFPAWLSPMLVRELRQGIQSGAFFWTFLLMQAALFLLASFTLLAATESSGPMISRGMDGFFWAILGITVGLVIPLRGMTAIASERAGNNLDLIQLTRLSATRIVVGKWAAIVAQAMLVAIAALPYLVLHYFFGGVNIVDDLARFAWLLVASAVMAAFAILASTRPQRERVGLLLIVGIGAWTTLVVSRAPMMPMVPFAGGWFWFVVPILYITLLLEAAAASIAPPAENHALRKRVIGLFCAGGIAATGLFGGANQFWVAMAIFGLPLLLLTVGALLERPVSIRRIHTAFARGGVIGRLAAAIFTPGWATGLVFLGLVSSLVAGSLLVQVAAAGNLSFTVACVSLSVAALLFPLPVLLLFPKVEAKGTLYFVVQMLCLVPWGVDGILSEMSGSGRAGFLPIVFPFPMAGLFRLASVNDQATAGVLFLAGCAVAAVVIALIARAWRREMWKTWRLTDGEPHA